MCDSILCFRRINLNMFFKGRLFLTPSGLLLDEVKSLLQKALRRKEHDLATRATKELLGRGKDQLPWKCILTYMFEDHCLNGVEVLEALVSLHKKKDKYGCIELIMNHCGTCRVAACLPVISLDKEYEPVDWNADITVEESLQNLVINDESRINGTLLLQHLKGAWLERNNTHLITYMKLITMINDHDKAVVTSKGARYCYFSELTKKASIVMVALSVLGKASRLMEDIEMEKYCRLCCYLATIKDAPLRLILSAAVTQNIHRDVIKYHNRLKVGDICWRQVRKLDVIPEWAVDKHTYRGKTGRSTKPYLRDAPEARGLSVQELNEFHGQRPKKDLKDFLNEGVKCRDELPVNQYWERCKVIYLTKPKNQQKTFKMTAVYYNYLMKTYPVLSVKSQNATGETFSTNDAKRKMSFGADLEMPPIKKMRSGFITAPKLSTGTSENRIEKYLIKELPCVDGPLLQLPTSSGKVYTRADLKNKLVWKGPYSSRKLSFVIFLHRLLQEVMGCQHTLKVGRCGEYLSFPLLQGPYANIKITEQDFYDCIARKQVRGAKFITRGDLDIIQLHKLDEHKISNLPASLWCHFFFRYIFNVGDSGLFNCITNSQLSFVYGIDLEERRGTVKDYQLLTLMFTKLPRKALMDAILKSMCHHKEELIRIMSQEFDVLKIKELAEYYGVEFHDSDFHERLSKLNHALQTQLL